MNLKKILISLWIILVILLWGWRFWHFVVQSAPLGYDPGNYVAIMRWYFGLLPGLDFNSLDPWIFRSSPPFVGMYAVITELVTQLGLDRSVTRWVAWQSALVSLALYFVLSKIDKRVALTAALLSWISFVQYQVFWRNYIKQLWGMFFVLMVIGLCVRKKYRVALPIIIALSVTHRPALLTLVFVVIFWVVGRLVGSIWDRELTTKNNAIWLLIWVCLISGVIALPIYRDFLEIQIFPLFGRFVSSIDVPTIGDWFKAGGTFMTTGDFVQINRVILLMSVIWCGMSIRRAEYRWIHAWYIFSMIWIFGQLAFYQRMMGYGDLFLLAMAGVGSRRLIDQYRKIWRVVLVGVFGIQWVTYAYRVGRSWRPLIEKDEFAFIQTLPDILPEDATVMSTHSIYSLRLNGRSERPTIAPGLFEIDQRNKSDRKTYRESDGEVKCDMLQETYWDTLDNIYIWQGSKQQVDDVTGGDCFSVYSASKTRLPWRMYEVKLTE